MKKLSLVVAFLVVCLSGIDALSFRFQFESQYPNHYPGRICMEDGTIKEFPAIRPIYHSDAEVWAWTNVEEFDKVTFKMKDVKWIEIWNAKAPEKKIRCINDKKHGPLFNGTYIVVEEVNGFKLLASYLYFQILDNGDLDYYTTVVYDRNGSRTVGRPEVYTFSIAKNKYYPFAFGYREADGSISMYDLFINLKSVLKDDKALVKELKEAKIKHWTYDLYISYLKRYSPSK